MTGRWIAFLRAINVGGHKVTMDRLRAVFEDSGHTGVETFIASGNVVFDRPPEDREHLEDAVEHALARALGYPVATFLRTPAELAAVVGHRPFAGVPDLDPARLHVALLKQPPAEPGAVGALETPDDSFEVHGAELYWFARAGLGRSKVSGAAVERALGGPATVRGIKTLRRLVAKYPQ